MFHSNHPFTFYRRRLDTCALFLSAIHQELPLVPSTQPMLKWLYYISTGCHVTKIEHSLFLPDSEEIMTRTVGRFDRLTLLLNFLSVDWESHSCRLRDGGFCTMNPKLHCQEMLSSTVDGRSQKCLMWMLVSTRSIFCLANRPVSTRCHCNRPKQSIPVGLKFAKLQIHSS